MKQLLKSQDGFAALIAMLLIGMLTLLGIVALSTSEDEMNIAGNQMREVRAFYAAEAGLEQAAAQLQEEYTRTGLPPLVMPEGTDSLNGCIVSYTTVFDASGSGQRVLTSGTLEGLHASVASFRVTDTAVHVDDRSRVAMAQSFETALVPIFQFAIFYDTELEIAPGPLMNLLGRVHTNGDLYIQATSNLNIDSYMTAAGEIFHGRKPGCPKSSKNGDVDIKDPNGDYISMRDGGGWLDAGDGHWYDSSGSRWGGRVQDSHHGQEELKVPLNGSEDDPHKLIEPGDGNPDSYELKSTLKIINDTAWIAIDTSWVDITDTLIDRGVLSISPNKFWDARQEEWVDVYDLCLERMYDSTFTPTATGVAQSFEPINGVIYFSSDDTATNYPALRLWGADELDTGLTVVSHNPMYTWGDYNSVDKKPAALMADAITFLSNQFDDNKSSWSLNSRNLPIATTVNTSFLTGNTVTNNIDYNGGFENLPRFLEKWTNVDFNWLGSAVNLWQSRQADEEWGKSDVYKAPDRNWFYDSDLDDPVNMPPEAPVVRIFQRTGWIQEYVGYDN
jgi:hypothetical protein